MRNGVPIEDAAFHGKVSSAGITHGSRYIEWEACIAARLDIERWENGGYDVKLMAAAVAWFVDHLLVKQHSADAANKR